MIGFLARKQDEIKLCWLVASQTFKHRDDDDLSHFKIIEIDIKFNLPFLDRIDALKRIEFVNSPGKRVDEGHSGALVIQTCYDIYFSCNETGYFENISNGGFREIMMIRGYNSHFYYAKKAGDTDDAVFSFKLYRKSQSWTVTQHEVVKVNEGQVIALEQDPDNRERTDSAYTYKNKLIEEQAEVLNKIFVIDDKETMFHIRQKGEEETGARYEIIEERNLSQNRNLTQELIKLKKKSYARVCIS